MSSRVPSWVPLLIAVAAPAALPSRSPSAMSRPLASAIARPATNESPDPTVLRRSSRWQIRARLEAGHSAAVGWTSAPRLPPRALVEKASQWGNRLQVPPP
jgi:hypothetical protein